MGGGACSFITVVPFGWQYGDALFIHRCFISSLYDGRIGKFFWVQIDISRFPIALWVL